MKRGAPTEWSAPLDGTAVACAGVRGQSRAPANCIT